MPSSVVIGFRNTPKVKTLIAPEPTMSPSTVAATTHQRFANIPRIAVSSPSLLPPVCWRCYEHAIGSKTQVTTWMLACQGRKLNDCINLPILSE
jgi:hypothetical protein